MDEFFIARACWETIPGILVSLCIDKHGQFKSLVSKCINEE